MIYAKPSTALLVVFRAYLDTDHVTPATGKTIAITISKNGGAFGNPNAGATNATEISSGFYKVTLDTTDTGTAGPLAVRGANADIDDVGVLFYVGQSPADVTHLLGTAWLTPGTAGTPDVNAKLVSASSTAADNLETAALNYSATRGLAGTALPNAAADAAGGLPISDAGGLDLDAQVGTDIDNLVSRLGTPSNLGGGATVSANLVDIEGQTDDIGTAGAGLSAIPWNAAWDAEVQSEVADALDAAVPGSPTSGSINERIKTMDDADMPGSLTTLLARITSTLFSGITSLAQWLGLIAGKQTGDSTARTEVRATGAGSGTYDETTDSQEAIRDRGDAAWTTIAAAAIRSALGMSSANLDTQLAAINTLATAIKAVTDLLPNGGALSSLATASALSTAQTDITTLLGRLTATRAGLLDELDPATAGKMAAEVDILISRLTALRAAALDNLDATVSSRATPAQVNAEVVDGLRTDTGTEVSAVPAAAAPLAAQIQFLFQALRNAVEVTSTTKKMHNDAGSVVATKALSDNGTTYAEGKAS